MTRKSCDSHVLTGNRLRHLKKKKLQETSPYCVLLRMKQVTYKGSTVIPTSSSLEMIRLNVYFMYNINIFEYIQDMCLLHYNIIQWDSEESQLTNEGRLP